MIEQIKQLRVEIDRLVQLCEGLNPVVIYGVGVVPSRHCGCCTDVGFTTRKGNSEEIKEAVKSLKLSKAWLGKVLESLGSENPYKSGYKTVEDIVPETDRVTGVPLTIQEALDYNKMSHIEKVDWLRIEVQKIWDRVVELDFSEYNHLNFDLEIDNFYTKLTEARFWLGFEMGRIRYESK